LAELEASMQRSPFVVAIPSLSLALVGILAAAPTACSQEEKPRTALEQADQLEKKAHQLMEEGKRAEGAKLMSEAWAIRAKSFTETREPAPEARDERGGAERDANKLDVKKAQLEERMRALNDAMQQAKMELARASEAVKRTADETMAIKRQAADVDRARAQSERDTKEAQRDLDQARRDIDQARVKIEKQQAAREKPRVPGEPMTVVRVKPIEPVAPPNSVEIRQSREARTSVDTGRPRDSRAELPGREMQDLRAEVEKLRAAVEDLRAQIESARRAQR
jgi:chromosome segregation ATPase